MAANEVLTERRGQGMILSFNRPDHANTLTEEMAHQLYSILKNTTPERGVRAVMLRGNGDHFLSGYDFDFFSSNIQLALDHANNLIMPYHSSIREMQSMDKPVLASVKGKVGGPGMSLMLASDFVIAAKSTIFNTGFAQYGMSPDGGCSYFLTRKLGTSRAVELMMLAEDFDAETAQKLHIVNRVVPDELLEEESNKWLKQFAEGPTRAYGAIKKLALSSFEHDLTGHLGYEHSFFGATSKSFDFREAILAYGNKRPPRFTGT